MTAPPSFTCPKCNMTSYDINDVRNGYCGNCHEFTGTGTQYAHLRKERTQKCPSCGNEVTMVPYDIGSGPEMSCPSCEWCWGADGQPLKPLDIRDFPIPEERS